MDILIRKFVMLHFFASYSDARKLIHDLVHSKIENSYLEKNSCKILILSNILLKIRKTRENILIKN